MGEVYEAEDLESGRRVALKVLGQSMTQPADKARFLREGRLAASISHPHCVYVYGTEEIQGTPVITMELVPGGTLKDRVKARGPLGVAEAVDAILQVISGLEVAAEGAWCYVGSASRL
jgi:serine/threonine protein kinase